MNNKRLEISYIQMRNEGIILLLFNIAMQTTTPNAYIRIIVQIKTTHEIQMKSRFIGKLLTVIANAIQLTSHPSFIIQSKGDEENNSLCKISFNRTKHFNK